MASFALLLNFLCITVIVGGYQVAGVPPVLFRYVSVASVLFQFTDLFAVYLYTCAAL